MWRAKRRRGGRSLTCAELVELVTDYLEGALPIDARGQVEAHLAACDGCTEYLDQIRRAAALLRLAPAPGAAEPIMLSDDACATLTAAFRDWFDTRPEVDH